MVYVIKKINLILILLLLIFISLGAVSAADDNATNDTVSISEVDTVDINEIDDSGEILSANEYTVTPSNYNHYFSSGGLSNVNDGDTLVLSGDFSKKKIVIDKNITLAGAGCTLTNCVVKILPSGSGTEVCDLKIRNNGDSLQGIYLNGASNCYIHDNDIFNIGVASYTIYLNKGSNFNTIANNTLETQGMTYGHGTRSTSIIVLNGANNNNIAENTIFSDDANAIYLSNYASGEFKGGDSFNNIIYKNNITYTVIPSSWGYAIQLMGGNNTVDSNIINGAYRGISSNSNPGNKAINNIIFIQGRDFSTNASTGGDYGIALSSNALIKNNTITGMFTAAAISASDNSTVEGNTIDASKGYAINAIGNNVVIKDNEAHTVGSAVIFQEGKCSGIVVDNNVLVSQSGIGVLLKKASKVKYPSNITITNNKITTSNDYIIDAYEADKNSYVIENNQGTGMIKTPNGDIDPTIPDFIFNGTTHYITPDNYHAFIDADGNLVSDVISDGDILYFNGTFSDKEILLTKSVKVTGNNPKFLNTTFIVTSEGVWIENLTIINQNAERYNAWGIFVVDTQTVKIVNNNISVYDPAAAYAVYVYVSSNVYVEDNYLYAHGLSLTYPLLGYGAENCDFKNNEIVSVGTGQIYQFTGTTDINANGSEECIGQCLGDVCIGNCLGDICIGNCLGDVIKEHCLDGTNIVPEIYKTYGILMIGSSNNTVVANNVNVTSFVNESNIINSTNSLVGIDFYYDCDNNTIKDNTILVEGNDNYLYGAGALARSTGQFGTSTAKNNTFFNNTITVNGYNVVEGLIFGEGCEDNIIDSNHVELNTTGTAYGITFERSDASTVKNNKITFATDKGYGIEAYDSSRNIITDNIITGNGSLICGIAGANTKSNVIEGNIINAFGTNSTIPKIFDVIKAPNCGIYFDGNSTANVINDNKITTSIGYPVELSEDANSNSITNNYLKGEIASGDEGVNNSERNLVKDNYYLFFNDFEMDNVTVPYMGNASITVKGNKDDDGAVVVFKINGNVIGNATLENGVATLNYTLTKAYNVGSYTITATVSKSGYKTVDVTADLKVVKANITIDVVDVFAKPGQQVMFVATVIDESGNPVASKEVRFYRNAQYMGLAVTDANGIATFNYKIPTSLNMDVYTISAIVAASTNYMQGIGIGTLDLTTATQIVANDVVMYCRDGTKFVATLKDNIGNPIANKNVTIRINGVSYPRTTDANGEVSLTMGLIAGNYPVTVSFAGGSGYKSSSANATVTIKPTMFSNDIVMMFKNGTQYKVKVMKGTTPVANEAITFNINGRFYHRTTDANGEASLAINLIPGTYIITAEKDTGEKISNTIEIKPILVDNNDLELYFKNGSGYTVKVLKEDGSVAGAGEEVTFNVNGIFYKRMTDENGTARLDINLPVSEYIITAEYKTYRVSNKIKVLPVLSASDLTKKYSEKKSFKANLLDGHGKPLANATVRFNINGVFYYKTTDENGTASLKIELLPGKYIITSSYNGGNIANDVTVTEG